MKKIINVVLIMSLVLSLFSGCNGNTKKNNGDIISDKDYQKLIDSYDWPDDFPKVPKKVSLDSYKYDDMSKKYDIELMMIGAYNQTIIDDPIKKYLNKKYNVSLTLTNVAPADLVSTVSTRFASNKGPDMVIADKSIATKLYDSNQIMETSKLFELLPQAMTYVTENYKNWATHKNRVIGIPRYNIFADNQWYFIRKDWLKSLNMSMPSNDEKLFEYAKAVTFNDPDKNGKNDTWFMGAAGGGNGPYMLSSLIYMFGNPTYNVVNGTINHPILDGTSKKYVAYIKKLVDAKVLCPDWYTISWEQFKSYSMTGKIGMMYYPAGNLAEEMYFSNELNLSKADVWKSVGALKSTEGKGGLLPGGKIPGGMFLFNKKLEKDEGKLERLCHIIDVAIYPNEEYWTISQGGGPDLYPKMSEVVFDEKTGTNTFYIDKNKHPAFQVQGLESSMDWQYIGYTLLWQRFNEKVDPVGKIINNLNNEVLSLERYNDLSWSWNFPEGTKAKVDKYTNKVFLQFFTGERSLDTWDDFVKEWRNKGGNELLKIASEKLKCKMIS